MSSSSLRSELNTELESLDQRYGNDAVKIQKRSGFKSGKLKKYKSNGKVEELAKEIKKSEEAHEASKKVLHRRKQIFNLK